MNKHTVVLICFLLNHCYCECPPNPIPNGSISFDFSNKYYQKYHISCNENYTLIGENNQKIICIDKKWIYGSSHDLPQCVKLCSPPPFLEHGHIEFGKKVEWQGKYAEGTVAKYSCEDDFVMDIDNKERICQNGDWTGVDLFCRGNNVKCQSPSVIDNGFFDTSWFESEFATMSVGQQITYHCMSGYRLMGPKVSKCTGEGVWSEAPICVKETDNPFADFTAPAPSNDLDLFSSPAPPVWNNNVPTQPQPFNDLTAVFNQPSVFDSDAKPAPMPQRPPQPQKILTGDLESSLNSLVENLTIDSSGGKWNSPKNQPKGGNYQPMGQPVQPPQQQEKFDPFGAL